MIPDHLVRCGWKAGAPPPEHTPATELHFAVDILSSRKAYFQCLASLDRLRANGLSGLPSGQSAWYYRAVLAAKAPAAVPRGLKTRQYRDLLEGKDGGADDEGTRPDRDTLGGHSPAREPLSDSSQDDFRIVGRRAPSCSDDSEEPDPGERLPPSAPAGTASMSAVRARRVSRARGSAEPPSSSSSSRSSSADSAPSLTGGDESGPLRQPVFSDFIRVEEHLRPGQRGHYRRYTIVCPLARTGHCSVFACGRRRNCGPGQMGSLGPAAPEAFLMVWREAATSFATKAEHMRWSPTWSEVRRFMKAQGWLPRQAT